MLIPDEAVQAADAFIAAHVDVASDVHAYSRLTHPDDRVEVHLVEEVRFLGALTLGVTVTASAALGENWIKFAVAPLISLLILVVGYLVKSRDDRRAAMAFAAKIPGFVEVTGDRRGELSQFGSVVAARFAHHVQTVVASGCSDDPGKAIKRSASAEASHAATRTGGIPTAGIPSVGHA